jgi:hypothetical protein
MRQLAHMFHNLVLNHLRYQPWKVRRYGGARILSIKEVIALNRVLI